MLAIQLGPFAGLVSEFYARSIEAAGEGNAEPVCHRDRVGEIQAPGRCVGLYVRGGFVDERAGAEAGGTSCDGVQVRQFQDRVERRFPVEPGSAHDQLVIAVEEVAVERQLPVRTIAPLYAGAGVVDG